MIVGDQIMVNVGGSMVLFPLEKSGMKISNTEYIVWNVEFTGSN